MRSSIKISFKRNRTIRSFLFIFWRRHWTRKRRDWRPAGRPVGQLVQLEWSVGPAAFGSRAATDWKGWAERIGNISSCLWVSSNSSSSSKVRSQKAIKLQYVCFISEGMGWGEEIMDRWMNGGMPWNKQLFELQAGEEEEEKDGESENKYMIFSSRAREGDGKRELKSFLSKIMLACLLADIEPPRMSGPKWLTDWMAPTAAAAVDSWTDCFQLLFLLSKRNESSSAFSSCFEIYVNNSLNEKRINQTSQPAT